MIKLDVQEYCHGCANFTADVKEPEKYYTGFDLETILQMNVEKLKARYPHGFDAGHSQHRSSGDI